MLLPLSQAQAHRIDFLPECGSTNSELVARAASGAEHFDVVVTDHQTRGRGRLGRTWVAPPGQTLAVSVLLRPDFAMDAWGWLPLVAGVAMARAVRSVVAPERAASVAVKWPNDVQVGEAKVSGLLAEVVAAEGVPSGVVLGAGLNLTIPADGLPTETSTSLTLEGAEPDALLDRALAAYLRELRSLYGELASGRSIHGAVAAECATLGRRVRVSLPSGELLTALAVALDDAGRLVVEPDGRNAGERLTIAAGDVTHVRYE